MQSIQYYIVDLELMYKCTGRDMKCGGTTPRPESAILIINKTGSLPVKVYTSMEFVNRNHALMKLPYIKDYETTVKCVQNLLYKPSLKKQQ